MINMAWSEKQKRIGALMKANTFIFWDFSDQFNFEYSFTAS